MKKYIALFVATFGFILLLGTAGACDADMITLKQTVTRCGIAAVMMVGGARASYVFESQERECDNSSVMDKPRTSTFAQGRRNKEV